MEDHEIDFDNIPPIPDGVTLPESKGASRPDDTPEGGENA